LRTNLLKLCWRTTWRSCRIHSKRAERLTNASRVKWNTWKWLNRSRSWKSFRLNGITPAWVIWSIYTTYKSRSYSLQFAGWRIPRSIQTCSLTFWYSIMLTEFIYICKGIVLSLSRLFATSSATIGKALVPPTSAARPCSSTSWRSKVQKRTCSRRLRSLLPKRMNRKNTSMKLFRFLATALMEFSSRLRSMVSRLRSYAVASLLQRKKFHLPNNLCRRMTRIYNNSTSTRFITNSSSINLKQWRAN
jgi:hypothetical protein